MTLQIGQILEALTVDQIILWQAKRIELFDMTLIICPLINDDTKMYFVVQVLCRSWQEEGCDADSTSAPCVSCNSHVTPTGSILSTLGLCPSKQSSQQLLTKSAVLLKVLKPNKKRTVDTIQLQNWNPRGWSDMLLIAKVCKLA